MSTAVAKQEENRALTAVPPPSQLDGLIAQDVIVPSLYLMQGQSEWVAQRKAALGAIVKSTTLAEVGNPEKPFHIIPLSLPTNIWRIEVRPLNVQGDKRYEFRTNFPRHAGNKDLPWKFPANANGDEVPEGSKDHTHQGRRVMTANMFALLPADIEADAAELKKAQAGEMPDLSKALTPVAISFRSTSFKAGKEINSHFVAADGYGQKGYAYMLQLGCAQETNDSGTFFVFTVTRNNTKPVPKELQAKVQYWADIVNKRGSSLKVDDALDGAESAGEGAAKQDY